MKGLVNFIKQMADIMGRADRGEISKQEALKMMKEIHDHNHMGGSEETRIRALAVCIEHNANFRNLPIWKEDIGEEMQHIRRAINAVGALQERFIMENMDHDPRKTHTVEQYQHRECCERAITRLVSELMSYASVMGAVDTTPFEEWYKEHEDSDE